MPLPEAPVSITLKATLHGHEVMVTLRGVDFASVKAQDEDGRSDAMRVQRYGNSRYWAVRDTDGSLICLCVYKRGALEVLRRLQVQQK